MYNDVLAALLARRSTKADFLSSPGPNDAELEMILRAGVRVPDHGRLTPWRIIKIGGPTNAQLGAALAAIQRADNPDVSEHKLEVERRRFSRAPIVLAVVSKVTRPHKIPEWEQILSVGALCQNILLATVATGFGAQWLTGWCAYDERVTALLGLDGDERIAGFIHIGTATGQMPERPRPELRDLVSTWRPVAGSETDSL